MGAYPSSPNSKYWTRNWFEMILSFIDYLLSEKLWKIVKCKYMEHVLWYKLQIKLHALILNLQLIGGWRTQHESDNVKQNIIIYWLKSLWDRLAKFANLFRVLTTTLQTWEKCEFVHEPDFVDLKCPHFLPCMTYNLPFTIWVLKKPNSRQKFRIRKVCHFPITFYWSCNFCKPICVFLLLWNKSPHFFLKYVHKLGLQVCAFSHVCLNGRLLKCRTS